MRLMPEEIMTDDTTGIAAAVLKLGIFFLVDFRKTHEVGLFQQYQENEIISKITRMLFRPIFPHIHRHLYLEPYPYM